MFTAPYTVTTEAGTFSIKFILDVAHFWANSTGKIVITDANGVVITAEDLEVFLR